MTILLCGLWECSSTAPVCIKYNLACTMRSTILCSKLTITTCYRIRSKGLRMACKTIKPCSAKPLIRKLLQSLNGNVQSHCGFSPLKVCKNILASLAKRQLYHFEVWLTEINLLSVQHQTGCSLSKITFQAAQLSVAVPCLYICRSIIPTSCLGLARETSKEVVGQITILQGKRSWFQQGSCWSNFEVPVN